LRANIHQLTLRLAMPIDGLFDISQELASIESQLKSRTLDAADREEIEARAAELKERRDGTYDYILERSAEINGVLSGLGPLARHKFDVEAYAVRTG
jgi:hypothetical protein